MSDRSVTTDALATLGTIIDEHQKRDAIHLAVLPVIAGGKLKPGQDVGLEDGKAFAKMPFLGIVDPFLSIPVMEGERFWLVIYPRVITSLRHVWSHPAVVNEPVSASKMDDMSPSERWIRNWAMTIPLDYDTIMYGASEYVRAGEYLVFGGLLEGEYVPDEFWPHYENVTGKTVKEDKRGSFFFCSC